MGRRGCRAGQQAVAAKDRSRGPGVATIQVTLDEQEATPALYASRRLAPNRRPPAGQIAALVRRLPPVGSLGQRDRRDRARRGG